MQPLLREVQITSAEEHSQASESHDTEETKEEEK